MRAETYTRQGTGTPASNYIIAYSPRCGNIFNNLHTGETK